MTDCPAESRAPTAPTEAWVSVDCIVVSAVAPPSGPFLSTSGRQRILDRSRFGFYVIGQGEAVLVAAGTEPVAERIVATAVPTGRRC